MLHILKCTNRSEDIQCTHLCPSDLFKKVVIQKLIVSSADTDNQRVIIKVKDINDEPPYFINRPLPMQVNTLKTKS